MKTNWYMLEIGDWVMSGSSLGQIVGKTKANYKVQEEGYPNREPVLVSIKSGKQHRSRSYWSYCEDPEGVRERARARRAEREEKQEQKKLALEAQIAAIKEANPTLEIEGFFADFKQAKFVDSNGAEGMITFIEGVGTDYSFDDGEYTEFPVIELNDLTMYHIDSWSGRMKTRSTGQSVKGYTTYDALISVISMFIWR